MRPTALCESGSDIFQMLLHHIEQTGRPILSPSRGRSSPKRGQAAASAASKPTLTAWIVLLQDRLDRLGRSVLDLALANATSTEPLRVLLTSIDPLYLPATVAADPDPGTGATLLHRAAVFDGVLALDVLLSNSTGGGGREGGWRGRAGAGRAVGRVEDWAGGGRAVGGVEGWERLSCILALACQRLFYRLFSRPPPPSPFLLP